MINGLTKDGNYTLTLNVFGFNLAPNFFISPILSKAVSSDFYYLFGEND
jgi:hypothetical protein